MLYYSLFLQGSHVVVPDHLCEEGVEADAVLSLTLVPPTPGLGGTGTFCSSDQLGRPIHLVFNWHGRPSAAHLASNFDQLKEHYRGLVLHEVLHGLGFGTFLWTNTFDSAGNRRNIVQQRKVVDEDGTEDVIYHFVHGTRTAAVAAAYFGCNGTEEWSGLPMMSYPPFGRDSHHETRILREDVMSYGDGDALSAITLATFEDTGHYLADYGSADCMHWGRGRGCRFIATRCTERPPSAVVSGPRVSQSCDREWPQFSDPQKMTLGKCAPADCAGRVVRGSAGGGQTCDVECYTGNSTDLTGNDATPCREPPPGLGEVISSSKAAWVTRLEGQLSFEGSWEGQLQQMLHLLGPVVLLFCLASCTAICLRGCLCPTNNAKAARRNFYLVAFLVLLSGLGSAGGGVYLLTSFPALVEYMMPGTVAYSVALALGVSAFAAFGIYAVCKSHMWKMRLVLLVKTTSILCCVFTGVFAFRFVRDADSMKRSTMLQAGAGGGAWEGTSPIEATDDVYKQMESFLCNTYRSCCEPKEFLDLRAASGGERRCGTPQRGMAEECIPTILKLYVF